MSFLKRLFSFVRPDDTFDAYTLSFEGDIVIVTATAQPGFDETLRLIDHLSRNKLYKRRLWDFSGIDFPFDLHEIREYAAYGRSQMRDKNRFAVLVGDDMGFGSMRAFSVYRQEKGITDVLVSRDRQEAIAWLSEDF
ncbi:MAG: hypothetical protein AAF660_02745 [Pseudomonadota bacterium]